MGRGVHTNKHVYCSQREGGPSIPTSFSLGEDTATKDGEGRSISPARDGHEDCTLPVSLGHVPGDFLEV